MIMHQTLYTSGEVRRLVGLSQRQLSYWDASALIRPGARAANGRGSRRLYTVMDVLQLKVVRRLLEVGLSLQKIRQVVNYIQQLTDEAAPFAELDIATNGHQVIVRRSDDRLVDPLSRQFLLRLPLADLLTEVQQGVIPASVQAAQDEARLAVAGLVAT